MGKFVRNLLIAAIVVVAIVAALPFVVPLGSYRGEIENAAQRATGRALRIDGPIRLTFFPHLGIKVSQVNFANMPGGRAAAMASVGDIRISLRLLPLLTGQVQVDKIILTRPVVAFEVDSAGHANWNLGGNAQPATKGGSSVTLPATTEFSGIEIDDGRIAYDNFKTGTHRLLDHVNAQIAITKLDKPIDVEGDLDVGGGRVGFSAKVATVQAMLDNGRTDLDLALKSDALDASFKAVMTPDGSVIGDASLKTSSLRNAAQALGEKLPSGGRFGAASFSAHVAEKDKIVTLSPLHLSQDGQTIAGTLTLDEHGNIPDISGTLTADRLDLNPFVASAAEGRPGGGAARASSSAWSNEPIDLSLLKSVNVNLSLSTGGLRLRQLKLGHLAATVSLKDGALVAQLSRISLYGGTGDATLSVDARGRTPQFRNDLDFEHLSLAQFLDDAIGIDSIEGGGALKLDVTAEGSSANAAMHSLAGSGSIRGSDGRIRGVDLGLVARTIQNALSFGATTHSANTGYHDMGGTFTIAHGVLTNADFHISGPIVQMTGAGTIDIGNRGIDFRLVPKAGMGALSVGIPFRIAGTWDHVHYMPDLAGLVNGVIHNFTTGNPLKGLFGGPQQQPQSKQSKPKPGLLHGVLGIP